MGLSRRRLLVNTGAGVLGIAVVGAACGSPSEPRTAPTGSPTASPEPSAASSGGGAIAGGWRRVDLSFVSAYLLIRGSEAAVVDLGTPGSGPAIEAGLKAAGSSWGAVRHV